MVGEGIVAEWQAAGHIVSAVNPEGNESLYLASFLPLNQPRTPAYGMVFPTSKESSCLD